MECNDPDGTNLWNVIVLGNAKAKFLSMVKVPTMTLYVEALTENIISRKNTYR